MSTFGGFMIDIALAKDREIAALEEKVRTLTARAEAAEKQAQSAERRCESAIGLLEKLYTIYEDGMSVTEELDRNIVDLLNRGDASPSIGSREGESK